MTDLELPALAEVTAVLRSHVQRHGWGRRCVALCSGGIDSTVLVLALREAGAPGLEIVHFEHGLRPESAAEADQVRDFAARMGLSCRVLPLQMGMERSGAGLEEEARRRRLQGLATLYPEAAGQGLRFYTGHHQDDAIETALLRLGRGASLHGLLGLRSLQRVEGLDFARPLLEVERSLLEAVLRESGLRHVEDASNQDVEMARRNRLRHEALPALRACALPGGLGRSLRILREEEALLEALLGGLAGGATAGTWLWRLLQGRMTGALLRHLVRCRTGRDYHPRAGLIDDLNAALGREAEEERLFDLGAGLRLCVWPCGTWDLSLVDEASPAAVLWDWRAGALPADNLAAVELHLPALPGDLSLILRGQECPLRSGPPPVGARIEQVGGRWIALGEWQRQQGWTLRERRQAWTLSAAEGCVLAALRPASFGRPAQLLVLRGDGGVDDGARLGLRLRTPPP